MEFLSPIKSIIDPCNIEMQKTEDEGAQPKRARRNGSLMDASLKSYGKYGELLPETYVIFITAFDYWKKGNCIKSFEREYAYRNYCSGNEVISR